MFHGRCCLALVLLALVPAVALAQRTTTGTGWPYHNRERDRGGAAMKISVAAIVLCACALPSAAGQDVPAQRGITGTGVIRGRVTAAESGRPLRRTMVVLTPGPASSATSMTTNTNAQGVFELREVPAGSSVVSANAQGRLTLQLGQRRPRDAAVRVDARPGQIVADRYRPASVLRAGGPGHRRTWRAVPGRAGFRPGASLQPGKTKNFSRASEAGLTDSFSPRQGRRPSP